MFEHIKEDVSIVFERDPAARTHWEILTTYPGVHALLMHRLSHWFWKADFFWLGRFLSHLGRWLTGIEIHPYQDNHYSGYKNYCSKSQMFQEGPA